MNNSLRIYLVNVRRKRFCAVITAVTWKLSFKKASVTIFTKLIRENLWRNNFLKKLQAAFIVLRIKWKFFRKAILRGLSKTLFSVYTTVIFIIFWDFLIFYQIFLSPHVKRSAIITNKYGVYKLPHKLPNSLRLRILEN